MEIDRKKEQVMRCIKLGMDLDTSLYSAACTDYEMEFLKADPSFLRRVKTAQAIEEMALLELHDEAMNMAAIRGGSSAIQWKLERLSDRWKNQSTGKQDGDVEEKSKIEIYLPGNGREK